MPHGGDRRNIPISNCGKCHNGIPQSIHKGMYGRLSISRLRIQHQKKQHNINNTYQRDHGYIKSTFLFHGTSPLKPGLSILSPWYHRAPCGCLCFALPEFSPSLYD